MSGALCEKVSGIEVGRVAYMYAERYNGGVTSVSAWVCHDQ